jgi:hypothetical protein
MAHLRIIGLHESSGPLREVYTAVMSRPLPPAYRPQHDDVPGIIRAHSLDHELMPKVFGLSGNLNSKGPLTWPQRELVNAITSRLNQCFY